MSTLRLDTVPCLHAVVVRSSNGNTDSEAFSDARDECDTSNPTYCVQTQS